ncbi:maltase 2-like isoform X2 [Culicoides brevitarsis]|uniref:maltase 2-like isoform X2 n=1 Tax=Culicoides brevitarsis TaxID=469753 RepID=UPI00307B3F95
MRNKMNPFKNLFFVFFLLLEVTASDEKKDWWQKTVFYQIYPRSFKDSNGDGIGDIDGITSKLEYLKETGVDAIWLSPIFFSPMVDFGYDIADYYKIHPEYGNIDDFDVMMDKAKLLDIKVILDFVPNHTSDQHEWFKRSVDRETIYEDYYIWHDGIPNPKGGQPLPPNNWVSVFYGSAWEYHPVRHQYYLHQFTKQQPDLNFRNPRVIEEMNSILRFWLGRGVSGFRIDAVNHLFEVEDFADEPPTGKVTDPLSYEFLHHYHTTDLPECYSVIYAWRDLLDAWQDEHQTETKIIMTEAYANLTFTMRYYGTNEDNKQQLGAHIPFNFLLISDLDRDSTAPDFVHTINKWLTYMPNTLSNTITANWVMGNHDRSRVATRYGYEKIDVMNMLLLTLPGIGVTYQGEEIGMTDYSDISWEDTKDPAALNTNPEVYKEYSRDFVRTPFQWDSSRYSGFTDGNTTWLPVNPNYRALNLKSQQEADKSHWKLYQQLTQLRNHATFLHGTFRPMTFGTSVIAYTREHPNSETFVVVLNLGKLREIVDLSVFLTLPDELVVEATGIRSTYAIGSKINASEVRLGKYESLLLRTNGRYTCLNAGFIATTFDAFLLILPFFVVTDLNSY